jgi:hypothetical protein
MRPASIPAASSVNEGAEIEWGKREGLQWAMGT